MMRMSIKRRLLISNILMIVIPIVLTIVILIVALFTFFDGGLITAVESTIPTVPIIIGEENDFSDLMHTSDNEILLYQLTDGNYILILPKHLNELFDSTDFVADNMLANIVVINEDIAVRMSLFEQQAVSIQVLVIVALLVVILISNYFLTKFVFQPIVRSLNVLTKGVDEISAGNLQYQLQHDMGNEFDAVGENFNQMANRLSDMARQRRLDEQNRKELIAGISHDLRTPLTSIRTYTEGLELGMAETPERQTQYLATIKQKTQDIEHIISQLFMFSKLDIGEFPLRLERLAVGDWLEAFVTAIDDEYSKRGLDVKLGQNVTNYFFLIDSVQFKGVLVNILENSLKYGRTLGGEVSINSFINNNEIAIQLTDNGPGVPTGDLDKLFDVFYRGDKSRTNPGSGSGLGLAIAKKMIECMHGSIVAENTATGGLRITIKLPVIMEVKSR